MVTLNTSFKRLKKLLGARITLEELEEKLFQYGMELDGVNGDELIIDITPDRADMVSPQGLARALRPFLGLDSIKYKVKETKNKFIITKELASIRPFAVGAIVKNVNFTDDLIKEIIWVQEKLHATYCRNRRKAAIGIYPLDNIKFPVYFKAKSPKEIKFIPLDFNEELTGDEILKKHPTGIKYAHLINKFSKYPVLEDSEGKILSMPPIINSEIMGKVTKNTKDVFIEVTGTNLETVNQILTLMATVIAHETGIIEKLITVLPNKEIKTPLLEGEKMSVVFNNVKELIGVELTSGQIKRLLKMMDYEILSETENDIIVKTPFYRTDILHEVDVIDDIARAYGFENIVPKMPSVSTTGGLRDETLFIEKLRDFMIGNGYLEEYTFALTTEEEQYKKMNVRIQPPHATVIEAKSPYYSLRTWILPELLKCVEQNLHRDFPMKSFDIGEVVIPHEKYEVKAKNELHLGVINVSDKAGYESIKKVFDALVETFDFKFELKKSNHDSFIQGRSADIYYKNKKIGVMGELHPKVITNFGIKLPVVAMEISFEDLNIY